MEENFKYHSETEDKLFPSKKTLHIKGKLFCIEEPWVMGILNITPDSFYANSRVQPAKESIRHKVGQMVAEGAKIIDVGGYSSRPNAENVTLKEELNRIIPVINNIKLNFPDTLVSIDTFRHQVAKEAIQEGADFVNDISGGELDERMIPEIGDLNIPYICMHMRGNPANMQSLTDYEDIEKDILLYFSKKLKQCQKAGIKDVIIDPGFGFAKTREQNYRILRNLSYFKMINAPILVGLSRKSMIYKFLDISPEESLFGTVALNMAALMNGAKILRVHDVKEAVETVKLFQQINT